MDKTKIRICTAGFTDTTWNGVIYPDGLKPAQELAYYEKELDFNCVEIDVTFYALISSKSTAGMERKTSPDFEFIAKAYAGITHAPFHDKTDNKKSAIDDAMKYIEKFLYVIKPFKDKGKLATVLLQFPAFFLPSADNFRYLELCRSAFKDTPLSVEFRNEKWAVEETYNFLKNHSLGCCNVDEPHVNHMMPFLSRLTSDIAFFRFHGRNKNWQFLPKEEKVEYDYTDKELEFFAKEISKAASAAKKVYVVFNNNYAGLSIKNAVKLKQILNIS
ncbi:MAG: DUF72 domain-containing protein [Candidatus Goldbacteria bacterium]|nr:DUF72 domain-containing protein [Candidatus Goldiibacteriota bacterium]